MSTERVRDEAETALEGLFALDRAAQRRIDELHHQNADEEAERIRLESDHEANRRRLMGQQESADRGYRLALQRLRDLGEANSSEYRRLLSRWRAERLRHLQDLIEELRQLNPNDPLIDTLEQQARELGTQRPAPAEPRPDFTRPTPPPPATPPAPQGPALDETRVDRPTRRQQYPRTRPRREVPYYMQPRNYTRLQWFLAIIGAFIGLIVAIYTAHPLFGDIHDNFGRILLEVAWYVVLILLGFFSFGWLGWWLGRRLGHHD